MKDDLNKPEDKKQKQPKFEKKSTDQRMQATPPVDNSGLSSVWRTLRSDEVQNLFYDPDSEPSERKPAHGGSS